MKLQLAASLLHSRSAACIITRTAAAPVTKKPIVPNQTGPDDGLIYYGSLGMHDMMHERQLKRFSSQMEWAPFGHLICTPVSLLVATSCLKARSEDLSQASVKELMRGCIEITLLRIGSL